MNFPSNFEALGGFLLYIIYHAYLDPLELLVGRPAA